MKCRNDITLASGHDRPQASICDEADLRIVSHCQDKHVEVSSRYCTSSLRNDDRRSFSPTPRLSVTATSLECIMTSLLGCKQTSVPHIFCHWNFFIGGKSNSSNKSDAGEERGKEKPRDVRITPRLSLNIRGNLPSLG